MKINEATNVQMPLKTVISLIVLVAAFTMGYFQITERLNNIETAQKLMASDLEKAVEFSIKWPRGELGSLPADAEQFMLLEHVSSQVEKIQIRIENMMHNKVNIERNQKDIEKALADLEKLKDKVRANGGNH
jgi:succinate dehydrogenase/fumarate reductase flavoprotein subunit